MPAFRNWTQSFSEMYQQYHFYEILLILKKFKDYLGAKIYFFSQHNMLMFQTFFKSESQTAGYWL